MNIATGITLMGRRQAEALMDSTCVIERAGEDVTDPDTGVATPAVVTVYTGPCRLRYPYVRPEQIAAIGQQVEKVRGFLSIPVDGTSGVQADDLATITLGDLDPGAVVVARVQAPATQTHMTARRLPVEIVSNR